MEFKGGTLKCLECIFCPEFVVDLDGILAYFPWENPSFSSNSLLSCVW